jgi:hypothetical protein
VDQVNTLQVWEKQVFIFSWMSVTRRNLNSRPR